MVWILGLGLGIGFGWFWFGFKLISGGGWCDLANQQWYRWVVSLGCSTVAVGG